MYLIFVLHVYLILAGCEFQTRDVLAEAIGKDKSELFFDKVRSLLRTTSNATRFELYSHGYQLPTL